MGQVRPEIKLRGTAFASREFHPVQGRLVATHTLAVRLKKQSSCERLVHLLVCECTIGVVQSKGREWLVSVLQGPSFDGDQSSPTHDIEHVIIWRVERHDVLGVSSVERCMPSRPFFGSPSERIALPWTRGMLVCTMAFSCLP